MTHVRCPSRISRGVLETSILAVMDLSAPVDNEFTRALPKVEVGLIVYLKDSSDHCRKARLMVFPAARPSQWEHQSPVPTRDMGPQKGEGSELSSRGSPSAHATWKS